MTGGVVFLCGLAYLASFVLLIVLFKQWEDRR